MITHECPYRNRSATRANWLAGGLIPRSRCLRSPSQKFLSHPRRLSIYRSRVGDGTAIVERSEGQRTFPRTLGPRGCGLPLGNPPHAPSASRRPISSPEPAQRSVSRWAARAHVSRRARQRLRQSARGTLIAIGHAGAWEREPQLIDANASAKALGLGTDLRRTVGCANH